MDKVESPSMMTSILKPHKDEMRLICRPRGLKHKNFLVVQNKLQINQKIKIKVNKETMLLEAVLVRVSSAVLKYHVQNQFGEERVYFTFHF